MMIDLVDSRKRSNSYENSSHIPATRMTTTATPSKNGGSLTPDRSSLLHTSKTPHHRTNFPLPYKPPVAPGYEPPSPRNCVTEAHATSMRGPMHALTVISDIPFDQEGDRQKDDDSDSQPGRIKPTTTTTSTNFPPKPIVSRTTTVLHDARPIVSPPTTGQLTSLTDSATPSIGGSGGVKISASFESRSPSPMAPLNIRTTASYRSNSPVLMIGSHSPARQQHQMAHNNNIAGGTSPAKSPPRLVSSLPLDEPTMGGRVTPSPTAFVREMTSHRQPSPLRNHSPLATTLMTPPISMRTDPIDEPPSLSGGYRMSPPRVSVPLPRPYTNTVEDEPSALTGDFSLEKPRVVVPTTEQQRSSPGRNITEPKIIIKDISKETSIDNSYQEETTTDMDEDDDSLFDFEERNKRREKSMSEESDDMSQDDGQNNKVDERVQAAWAQHRRSVPSATSPVATTTTTKVDGAGQSFGVKFGKDDIVHNFDPNSGDADETFDNTTLGGHSLNSLYTKSAESEVEDIIKDIFLIGSGEATNPGRRKFKYKAGIKDDNKIIQSRDEQSDMNDDDYHYTDEEDGDIGTYEDTTTFTDTTGLGTGFDTKTNDDSTNRDSSFLTASIDEPQHKKKNSKSTKEKTSDTIVEEEKKEDDPLTDAWAFVESKINEVGAALGLETPQADSTRSRSKENSNPEASSKSVSSKDGFVGWDFWNYLLGPAESLNENPTDEGSASLDRDVGVSQSQSLEEDSRFIDLALQAAISIHRIKGYEYNTEHEMDVINDVRFSVVDLTLPLGVIFQENEKGCWVNQILPEGSAAASRGGVKVGDQLAAVDGLSAIDMTVDEIAKLIRVKKAAIELTFVRYVGPLRPMVTQDEGYEVSATPPRKKLTWPPPSTPTTPPPPPVNPQTQHSSPSSPRGILKKNKNKEQPDVVPKATPSSTTSKNVVVASQSKKGDTTKGKEEPKKRFRLFGRRK